jgi:hypothetical protein
MKSWRPGRRSSWVADQPTCTPTSTTTTRATARRARDAAGALGLDIAGSGNPAGTARPLLLRRRVECIPIFCVERFRPCARGGRTATSTSAEASDGPGQTAAGIAARRRPGRRRDRSRPRGQLRCNRRGRFGGAFVPAGGYAVAAHGARGRSRRRRAAGVARRTDLVVGAVPGPWASRRCGPCWRRQARRRHLLLRGGRLRAR